MPQQWPTAGDYTTALQNPKNCFKDPQFQSGQVGKKLMGVPVGSDGNAAIVFELRCPGVTYAVKCFKRAVSDRQQHYNELSQRLNAMSSPFLTDFTYLSDTILVRGEWFPVLRMAWVNPNQLGNHLEKCLAQRTPLAPLANSFRELVQEIRQLNIVHGDLQHGNILVELNGHLRLIDYDGTCVLPWAGAFPDERGHPNYQHPERLRDGHYERNTDAFASQVIYLSILALEAEPGLWQNFNNAENLIFTRSDFDNPGGTPIWNHLRQSSNSEVQRLTEKLEEACRDSVHAVVPLEDLLTPPAPRARGWKSYAASTSTIGSPSAATAGVAQQGASTSIPGTTISAPAVGGPNPPAGVSTGAKSPFAPSVGTPLGGLPIAPIWAAQGHTGAVPQTGTPMQERWDDSLPRQLRSVLLLVALIAIALGVSVFLWLRQIVPSQTSPSPNRGMLQKPASP